VSKLNINRGQLPCRALTKQPGHHYFGYYDKCPYDPTGRYLLALEVDFMDRPPKPDDEARIGIVDLQGRGEFEQLGTTRAWNWQQGTHLQWLPSSPGRKIIYNIREADGYHACIQDIDTGNKQVLPRPIYAVSRNGSQAVSVNFSRIHDMRPGYGYNGLSDSWADEIHPEEDGIYWMDLHTGDNKLIISLAQIAAIAPDQTTAKSKHWFNHLQFSTDDARFVFLHRWKSSASRKPGIKGLLTRQAWLKQMLTGQAWFRRFLANRPGFKQKISGNQSHTTRMFTANADGSDVYLLNRDDMTSHFDWKNSNQIIAWARRHGIGDRYFLFTDRTDDVEVIGEDVFSSDGHCSYSPDGRFILTDTYPQGVDHLRTLILYNTATGERSDIGQFYSPPELQGEIRCDLHPRWNRDGTRVCFDSMHEGERQIYELDVSAVVSP
jgi:hypothetical protein